MNIAITANTSWYLYNFRKNTFIRLIQEGYKVYAISPEDEYSEKLQELGVTFINVNINKSGVNPIQEIATLFSFYYIYRKLTLDVVLNFTPKNNVYSTIAAKLRGISVINNIAGLGVTFIKDDFKSKFMKALYRISQKFADIVFFQNEDDRTLFIDNNLINIEKTDRLPGSGVDLSRFLVSEAPNDDVVRFLLIARMLHDKGIGHYVEAARVLKSKFGSKVEFRLLGFLGVDNPSAVTKTEMDSWVKEGVVTYLGTSDSVETEIAFADCIVLPSYYREGVPKTLLEAGAMGKPIVTTDNVGCRETVDEGINGYLCFPRSTNSLVASLESMFSLEHDKRVSMGVASRKKVEQHFDEEIVINKYISAINKVFKDKK